MVVEEVGVLVPVLVPVLVLVLGPGHRPGFREPRHRPPIALVSGPGHLPTEAATHGRRAPRRPPTACRHRRQGQVATMHGAIHPVRTAPLMHTMLRRLAQHLAPQHQRLSMPPLPVPMPRRLRDPSVPRHQAQASRAVGAWTRPLLLQRLHRRRLPLALQGWEATTARLRRLPTPLQKRQRPRVPGTPMTIEKRRRQLDPVVSWNSCRPSRGPALPQCLASKQVVKGMWLLPPSFLFTG
jgi:hypothetical protein